MALAQRGRDLDAGALAVTEREDLARARRELHGALGKHHERLRIVEAPLRCARERGGRVRRLDRVEQVPEDLALALERGGTAVLVFLRARMLDHEPEPVPRIARRLHGAAAEI